MRSQKIGEIYSSIPPPLQSNQLHPSKSKRNFHSPLLDDPVMIPKLIRMWMRAFIVHSSTIRRPLFAHPRRATTELPQTKYRAGLISPNNFKQRHRKSQMHACMGETENKSTIPNQHQQVFCQKRVFDVLSKILIVTEFQLLHDKRLGYSALCTARSALYNIITIDGKLVGEHPIIIRCMRGDFNNPALPKLTVTWNHQIL